MTDEFPTRTCDHFDNYLGICDHPKSRLTACREKVCPLIKEDN